jgi:hypothetical protein
LNGQPVVNITITQREMAMKRTIAATVFLALAATQAFAAGSIQISGTQQFDTLGKPLNGGKLVFPRFQGGTFVLPAIL